MNTFDPNSFICCHGSKYSIKILFLIISILFYKIHYCCGRPNIVIFMADDLGFNDVSFRGSLEIPTLNIDSMAYSGVILNSYYMSPICTPSRSSLFSGKHPIHTGMQNNVIYGTTPYGFPLNEKLLSDYLKSLNYKNHLVGKWHLGHYRRSYTPLCRGFDSHFGHWTGHKDYYDNTAEESNPEAWGTDMRRNFEISYEDFGIYTTDVYTRESIKIIKEHDEISNPLFLMVSHDAVHSANPYRLLQAPFENVEKYEYIKDKQRRLFAGMVDKLDESFGDIVLALSEKGILNNTIIIFTTDNGGPAAGFNGNAASNWPLRGVKNTLWEGGVRGAGFIWSPLLKSPSTTFAGLFHIQDWLPTLIRAIGEDPLTILPNDIDGIDMWDALNEPSKLAPRLELLHNIDDIYGNEGLRFGKWKILNGTTYNGNWDGWYGPPSLQYINLPQISKNIETSCEQFNDYYQGLLNSQVGISIKDTIGEFPHMHKIKELQKITAIDCGQKWNLIEGAECNLKNEGEFCLFNIEEDPCEKNNLATEEPIVLALLKDLLLKQRNTAVKPINQPKDPRGQPKFWNYTWTNWMDFVEPMLTSECD